MGRQIELKVDIDLGFQMEVNPILKKGGEEEMVKTISELELAKVETSEGVELSTSSETKITTTLNFITKLGLLQEGEALPDDLFVSVKGEGFYRREPFNLFFTNKISRGVLSSEVDAERFKLIRFGLSHHNGEIQHTKQGEANWINSKQTFKKTKIVAWVDIDIDCDKNGKPIDHIDILTTFPKIPEPIPQPTAIKKTYKGWHLFWVVDEYFTREEAEVLEDISKYIGNQAKKYLSSIIEASKIEVKSPLLAETRITTSKLYAVVYNIIPKSYIIKLIETRNKEIRKTEDYLPTTEIGRFNLEQVKSVCKIWQQVEDTWDRHHYNTWFLASYFYALDYVINGNKQAEEEFLTKSSKYIDFTIENAKNQWDYTVNWLKERIERREGYLFTCETIREKASQTAGIDVEVCKGCGIRNNPFKELKESQDDTLPLGYERKGEWICYRDEENNLIKLVKEFAVIDIYRVVSGGKDISYVKFKTHDNQTFEVEYDYTSSGNINVGNIRKYLFVNPNANERKIQKLISAMIEQFKILKGRVDTYSFIGYKAIGSIDTGIRVDYVVAGKNSITRADITKFITHSNLIDEEDLTIPIPEVKGEKEKWINSFRNLHRTRDSLLASIIGFSLLQLNKKVFDDIHFTPILIIRALKGAGKTLRMELASTLFTSMGTFSYISTTKAKILNFFGGYKFPIFFDEVIAKEGDKVKDLKELIYSISNKATKEDAYKTTYPITSPVILAGETSNLLLDELITGGITRRVIPLDIDKKEFSTSLQALIKERRVLRRNYGFIVDYIKEFVNVSVVERLYEEYIQKIENERIGYESKTLIASILTNYKIFTERVLGDELDKEFEKTILELLLKGAKSLEKYDEEAEEGDGDILQEVKLIQEKVVKVEQKDKLGTSRQFKTLEREAKLNFSNTEKDKKTEIAWKLLTGRAYSVNGKYYIKSYTPSNLLNALLYEYNQYQLEEKLNAEINRIRTIIPYIKTKEYDKTIFKEVYLKLISEVLEKYPDREQKIKELVGLLKEEGVFSQEADFIFGSDEAVEF